MSFLTFPDHLHQLPSYQTALSYKASLALVCRAWTPSALEVLYHSIWIFRAKVAKKLAQSLLDSQSQGGSYIRALHVETSVMERVHPADMAIIVGCAKGLEVYKDVRSIRRAGMGFFVLDAASITATSSSSSLPSPGLLDGDKGTEDMLSLLPSTLRRLSWTNYEHDERDYEHGVRFYTAVVGPQLERAAAGLEFLELSLSAGPGPISHMLTELSLGLTSTTTSTTCPLPTIPYTSSPPLLLPSLLSLKATLDNATFSVLSTWDMPALQNLSVLSADFSYTGEGFAAFFEVHGDKLRQLELGHSTGAIEDFWLTAPRTAGAPLLPTGGGSGGGGIGQFPLAEWCPNLEEFICSADAEWNWQSPDWIAPHVLLPTHPGLKFIGVRDMEKRIRDDLDAAEGRRLWDGDGEEDPLFMLLQQFGSLLRSEAFPSLLYVRDMSGVSGYMRRVGRVPASSSSLLSSTYSDAPATSSSHHLSTSASSSTLWRLPLTRTRPTSSSSSKAKKAERMRLMKEERDGRRVLKFWKNVLERCKERGVWLEDWEGVSVTLGDLKRAEGGGV